MTSIIIAAPRLMVLAACLQTIPEATPPFKFVTMQADDEGRLEIEMNLDNDNWYKRFSTEAILYHVDEKNALIRQTWHPTWRKETDTYALNQLSWNLWFDRNHLFLLKVGQGFPFPTTLTVTVCRRRAPHGHIVTKKEVKLEGTEK
jgi:hypothetical protein